MSKRKPIKDNLYKDEDIKNMKNLFYLPFKRRSTPTIDHSSFLLLDKLIIIHFTSFCYYYRKYYQIFVLSS